MNLFDPLKAIVFDAVTGIMGNTAYWTPSTGGELQTAYVLYNDPTQKETLQKSDFNPEFINIEYKSDCFIGLKLACDQNLNEEIIIESIGEFYVRSVSKIHTDGNVYRAILEMK